MMPVMRVHVRLTMVMPVIFVMVDVVLHMREARVVGRMPARNKASLA